MVAMTSQMDSAIAKSRTSLELAQRTRELEAIYRIDHIRDQIEDFDEMLHRVLLELCDVVDSETGYLLLFNTVNSETRNNLEIRASTREDLVNNPEYMSVIKRVSQEALDSESVVTYNELEGAIHSIIAIPLVLNSQVMGVFGSINSHNPRGFSGNDGRIIAAITSQVDTAVFERLERRRMRQVLSRSVDPKVLEALLTRADDSLLAGERVVLTVLFADLRGSTEWAERTEPEELVAILNTFLGLMTDVIFKHGGTLDKFVGDEVIALFGTPMPMEHHALNASRAAIEMQLVHEKIRAELKAQGRELPQMGVGVNTGEVIAGEFGPPMRTDFTAMGRVMNLGARLCSAATGNQIIISQSTLDYIDEIARVQELEAQELKGIQRTIQTYELLSLSE
jgi:adenylate cyclase